MSNNGTGADKPMPLSSHLNELRKRLILVVIVFIAAFGIGLAFAAKLTDYFTDMAVQYGYEFVFIAPQELILVYFQIALICGGAAALPAAAYEFYEFAIPALEDNEKKAVLKALWFGFAMFAAGVLFAYRISLPFMLNFLISLNIETVISASISIQNYITFVMTIFLIFGIVFEMPVISALLTRLGVLRPEWLRKTRKIAVVVIFLIAAVITPPEVVSQIMVALPMIVLYEVSILVTERIYKRKEKKKQQEDVSKE